MKKVILFVAFIMLAVVSMFAQTVYETTGIKVEINGKTGANTNFKISNKLSCTQTYTLVYNNGTAESSGNINQTDSKEPKLKLDTPMFTFTSKAACDAPYITVTINSTLPVKITNIQTKLIITNPKS